MQTSAAGLALIETSEEYRQFPYQDLAGVWTVGYGHKILPGEDFSAGLTRDQAQTLLAADLAKVEAALTHLVPSSCTQNQWDACADFGFNLGVTALATMLAHGWGSVPAEMPLWVYAAHVVQPGLQKRRAAEVTLFNS